MSQRVAAEASKPWVVNVVEHIRKEMRDERERWFRIRPYIDYDCSRCGVPDKCTFRRNPKDGERAEEFICGVSWECLLKPQMVHGGPTDTSRLDAARARHRTRIPPGLVIAAPPGGANEDGSGSVEEESSFDQQEPGDAQRGRRPVAREVPDQLASRTRPG